MEIIMAWLVNYGLQTAAGTIGAIVLGWILAKIPTDKFAHWAKEKGVAQGKAVSGFFKSKFGKIWDNGVEPIVIDTINAVGIGWLSGFIEGLKSDND